MKRVTLQEASKLRKLELYQHAYIPAIAFALGDHDEQGFQEVTYYGESLSDILDSSRYPEWIYILVNTSIPGILKIGYTSMTVTKRVSSINAATGVIVPWFSVFQYKCANGRQLEAEIHKYLEGYGVRVNPAREGFEIEIDDAIHVVESIGNQYRYDI